MNLKPQDLEHTFKSQVTIYKHELGGFKNDKGQEFHKHTGSTFADPDVPVPQTVIMYRVDILEPAVYSVTAKFILSNKSKPMTQMIYTRVADLPKPA